MGASSFLRVVAKNSFAGGSFSLLATSLNFVHKADFPFSLSIRISSPLANFVLMLLASIFDVKQVFNFTSEVAHVLLIDMREHKERGMECFNFI